MPRILIVEDEIAIADTLVFALNGEGFSTHWVRLAREAIECVERETVDLVILDVGLPDVSGFEACKILRKSSDVPILFLTARSDEIDRVVGLEIGADDVVKPFSPREVAVRVRTILKRVRTATRSSEPAPQGAAPAPRLDERSEFAVDTERLLISYEGQPLKLTPQEFRLLQHLLGQPERVFSRQQLLDAVGASTDAVYERNIDGHVRSLRAKLRDLIPDRDPIQTHRGFGYSYQPKSTTDA